MGHFVQALQLHVNIINGSGIIVRVKDLDYSCLEFWTHLRIYQMQNIIINDHHHMWSTFDYSQHIINCKRCNFRTSTNQFSRITSFERLDIMIFVHLQYFFIYYSKFTKILTTLLFTDAYFYLLRHLLINLKEYIENVHFN